MNNCLIRYQKLTSLLALLIFSALIQISCGGGNNNAPSTVHTVSISWNPNRETAVNTLGGGYKVYYSTNFGFNISGFGVNVVDVPFVAPPSAPTTTSLQLASGNYYFRIVAYSALNPPGGNSGSTSPPSNQIALTVP